MLPTLQGTVRWSFDFRVLPGTILKSDSDSEYHHTSRFQTPVLFCLQGRRGPLCLLSEKEVEKEDKSGSSLSSHGSDHAHLEEVSQMVQFTIEERLCGKVRVDFY